jgi:methanogenic corrinoid protein MtbC1
MGDLSGFIQQLKDGNKEACVRYCLDLLESGKTDIRGLYEGYLKEALNRLTCDPEEKELCIWREHEATAIVRTVIECAYPFVIRERDMRRSRKLGKAVVLCPESEYHEIGARMIADYLTILGYEAIFVGSNTPRDEIFRAVQLLGLDLVALSVTNYYNMVAAKKMLDLVREKASKPIRIILGGQAFKNNPELCKKLNADMLLQTFEDLEAYLDAMDKDGES